MKINPTNKQIDRWAAEALEWTLSKYWDGKRNTTTFALYGNTYKDKNGKDTGFDEADWHPTSDLSLAWKEFVLVLGKKEWRIHIIHDSTRYRFKQGTVCARPIHPESDFKRQINGGLIFGEGTTEDQKAAYALTYAFVQIMEPAGYIEWKETHVTRYN